jgi:hypothetical protein
MQEEGRYTVEQIALSHFKLDVAYKNNVGPYAKSKKHAYNGDDQDILPRNREGGFDCGARWTSHQPCPIFDSESRVLTRDDVLTVLKRMPASRNCTGHTEMIENCIMRAKLGASLTAAAAANERFEMSDDGDIDGED